ncbi:MAG: hypothetical protein SX243_13660 [Acidobacteriota bacterium]|nr:hypothetical protein [Acidobacteriota bacterium]
MRFKRFCLALTLALLVIGSVSASADGWFSVVEEEGSSVIESWLPWQGMEELFQDLLENLFGATGSHGNAGGNSATGGGTDDGGQGTTGPAPPGGDGVGTMIDPNGLL